MGVLYPNYAFSAFEFSMLKGFLYFKMKRRTKMKKILALLVVLALSFCMMASCSDKDKNESEGTVTLVIATEEPKVYKVPLDKLEDGKGLMPMFEYLKEKKGLEFDISGTMINSIGGLENDYEMGRYIYIYTSVKEDFDVSQYASEIEYKGETLVSAGIGFNEMRLKDGAVIYIGLISW